MREETRAFLATQRRLGLLLVAAAALHAWLAWPRGLAAVPLAALGAAMIVDAQRRRAPLLVRLAGDPVAFQRGESARLARLSRGLRVAAGATGALFVAAIALRWWSAAIDASVAALVVAAWDVSARRQLARVDAFLDPRAPIGGEREWAE